MAGSLNSVVLVGRLTRDVEVRKTASGISMARFTVAVDRRVSSSRDNGNGGNGQQPTADFISCIAWRQRADFLGSYGRKGTLIGVEGSIQTGSYTNQSGQKVNTTDVVADNVQLLESRSASQNRSADQSYGNTGSYSSPAPSYESVASSSANSPSNSEDFDTGPDLDISSDDLPF